MSAFYAGEFVVERGFGKHARTNASIFHIVVKVRVSEVRFAEPIGFNFPDPDFWVFIFCASRLSSQHYRIRFSHCLNHMLLEGIRIQ